jgi:uncharacterized membrane protein YagU involved in acid resistance
MGRRIAAALVGGILAGTLDIFVACAIARVTPDVILHFLAAGLIGRDAAFHGGVPTMALGLAIQEFISVVAALLFVLVSTRLPVLLDRPILSGVAYGAACNLFLTFVVQPLSHVARTHPIAWTPTLENLAANMILFGPPIALVARWMLKRS